MIDVVQRVLAWLLTLEVVGLLASLLTALGLPPMLAPIVVVLGLLLVLHKVTSDRFMLQRWRMKLRRTFSRK